MLISSFLQIFKYSSFCFGFKSIRHFPLHPFERIVNSLERIINSFERLIHSFERIISSFERLLIRLNGLLIRLNGLSIRLNGLAEENFYNVTLGAPYFWDIQMPITLVMDKQLLQIWSQIKA